MVVDIGPPFFALQEFHLNLVLAILLKGVEI